MNDDYELNIGDLRQKRRGSDRRGQRASSARGRRGARARNVGEDPQRLIENAAPTQENSGSTERWILPFDPWRLVEAVRRKWFRLASITLLFALVAVAVGDRWATYPVYVDLLHRDPGPSASAPQMAGFQPRELSFETLESLLRSTELLRAVVSTSNVPITTDRLSELIYLHVDRNPETLTVALDWKEDPQSGVRLANRVATELIRQTEALQQREAEEIAQAMQQKIAAVDADLEESDSALFEFARSSELLDVEKESAAYLEQLSAVESQYVNSQFKLEDMALRLRLAEESPGAPRLQTEREELDQLLLSFTDAHPKVVRQKALIEELERQASRAGTGAGPSATTATGGTSLSAPAAELRKQMMLLTNQLQQLGERRREVRQRISGLSQKAVQYALLRSRIQSLEELRSLMVNRQREAELAAEDAWEPFKLFAPATVESVEVEKRWFKIAALGVAGGLLGFGVTLLLILLSEATDSRVKTASDLRRISRLPVLATLGDLKEMDQQARVNWGFRTLTLLKGKLNAANGHSLVCGFMSAQHGEGRSTWINLLVSAASQRGLRVLRVETRPPREENADPPESAGPQEAGEDTRQLPAVTENSSRALAFPAEIEEQLNDPQAQPVVHIPLPGWVWDVERRAQWKSALEHWRKIENLVLLVELPPASQPESFLLAENVPQVIWLTGSGMVDASETEMHLETLRHSRCRLAGAVLNREPASPVKSRVSRWVNAFSACLALTVSLAPVVAAEDPDPAAPETGLGRPPFSFSAAAQERAPWQKRLTLGAGDVVSISIYGMPELTRTNLLIGPDGRLNYLQARNVPAAGLTVDELREQLDDVMGRYVRAARTLVSPVALHSKKYYLLGKVRGRGVYTLDRPLTVIEAVGRAGGLETGLSELNTVELADLSRSFLVRDGQKLGLDLEKLFLRGDLSQNVPLAPGDYLYFASTGANEIYVLGEVTKPGVVGFVPTTSLVAALTSRGGFTGRAYQKRVLVVRGSLSNPQTFVVDVNAILAGEQPGFRLEQRDIVYVSRRPWWKAEELLDEAGQAFVQAVVATWTGVHIGPILNDDDD